jgi:HEAT repeat protein
VSTGPQTTEEPSGETAAPRQTTPFLVLQFFIFPMAIVAVCVAVFVVFGLIASEGKGARDYLNEVRTGGANRRWQAAFELSKVLQARKDPALSDPRFVDEVAKTFEEAQRDDPRVRRYLALALGRIGDPRVLPTLRRAIAADAEGPIDTETQIYAVWALGVIGDPAALPDLVRLARGDDPGLRKAAVHALGSFATEVAREALAAALQDPVEDVRWNAAIALARRRDARAIPVLLQMMDPAHMAQVPDLAADQREDAVLQAVTAAAAFPEPEVRAALERLRDRDPSMKVREAARRAVEAKPAAVP